MKPSGCGAVGSALPWGGRGRGFKSRHSDQCDQHTPENRYSNEYRFFLYIRFYNMHNYND